LDRVNARLARATAEQQMMQMRVAQLQAEAAAQEEGCWQVISNLQSQYITGDFR
jgi:hypothetical protein